MTAGHKTILGLCASILSVLSGGVFAIQLDLDPNVNLFFPNIEAHQNELHFSQLGNDFGGVMFWLAPIELTTPEPMQMTNSAENFLCHAQLRGLYFNPQRGNFLWPLDATSLATLKTMSSSYATMTAVGGLFGDCEGRSENTIYGQIEHSIGSAGYKIVAGVQFSGNSYLQNFANSSHYLPDAYVANGGLFDSRGGVASVIPAGGLSGYFSFPIMRNVELSTFITSQSLHINMLPYNQTASATVRNGTLLINGLPSGTSGAVRNGDNVAIILKSANSYDTVTSADLNMGAYNASFYVITKLEDSNQEECELDISDQMRIYSIFELLKDTYDSDPVKEDTFLYTLKSMLEDRIDLAEESCGDPYQYLLDITDAYLLDAVDDEKYADEDVYIAPNCKQYHIDYENDRQAYFSEDFRTIQYFVSMDALKTFINKYNPGNSICDTVIDNNTNDRERRVAPNGKVYRIKKTASGYSSDDFIYAKTFTNLTDLRKYIDMNNPKLAVRNHVVDDSFDPVTYLAPNSKEYKIQKVTVTTNNTDVSKYMSYKFVTPKYFDSLEAIKAHIDQYNPSATKTGQNQ